MFPMDHSGALRFYFTISVQTYNHVFARVISMKFHVDMVNIINDNV